MAFDSGLIYDLTHVITNDEVSIVALANRARLAFMREFSGSKPPELPAQINYNDAERANIKASLANRLYYIGQNMEVFNRSESAGRLNARIALTSDLGTTDQQVRQLALYALPPHKPVDPTDPGSGIDPQAFQKEVLAKLNTILKALGL